LNQLKNYFKEMKSDFHIHINTENFGNQLKRFKFYKIFYDEHLFVIIIKYVSFKKWLIGVSKHKYCGNM
jgi:hypothetical protein